MRALSIGVLSAAYLAFASSACDGDDWFPGPSGPGVPMLSVVGQPELDFEFQSTYTLQVRYHDSHDRPLQGEITFEVEGDPADHALSTTTVSTGADGRASVQLQTGVDFARFRVAASVAETGAKTSWFIGVRRRDPMVLSGGYELISTINLLENPPPDDDSPGAVFLDIADSPGGWILNSLADADELPPLLAEAGAAFVDGVIAEVAPELVETLLEVHAHVHEASEHFGIVDQIDMNGQGTDSHFRARGRNIGYVFDVGGERVLIPALDLDLDFNIEHRSFSIELDVHSGLPKEKPDGPPRVDILKHTVQVHWGRALGRLVDVGIPPRIDPAATNIIELLLSVAHCDEVGARIADEVPLLTEEVSVTLCEFAIHFGAGSLVASLDILDRDAKMLLDRWGHGDPEDADADNTIELIEDGEWWGDLHYDLDTTELEPRTATFEARRPVSSSP